MHAWAAVMLKVPAASELAAVPARASETASVAMVMLLELPAVVQASHTNGCAAPVAPYSQYTFVPASDGEIGLHHRRYAAVREGATLHSLTDTRWHCAPRIAELFGPNCSPLSVALEAMSAATYRAPP